MTEINTWGDPGADPASEWTGHRDPADQWDRTRVVWSDLDLLELKPGARIRELGATGRLFIVGARPTQLWHGETPCHPSVLELPVEVTE